MKRSKVADGLSEAGEKVGLDWLAVGLQLAASIASTNPSSPGDQFLISLQSTRMCRASLGPSSSGRWDEIVIRDQLYALSREQFPGGGQG